METRYDKYEPFFGSWYIKNRIGRGAAGEVFLIEREDYGNVYRAALKCMTIPQSEQELRSVKAEGMTDAEVRDYYQSMMNRIKSELINMAHMKGNSNVVSYEDHMIVPHEDGIGWDIMIRMELLTTLYQYCDDHQMSEEEILKMGIDLSKALELCANSGIIHRDLKPDNIFVSANGEFKLGDFGVSRVMEETQIGLSLRGTYTYMAPEVYKGEPYGPRTDIYSLGLILYKFLNGGRNAFLPDPGTSFTQDDEDRAFFRRMSGAALPPPINGSEDLKSIVLKACAYRAKDRFRSAGELRAALTEIDYRLKYAEKIVTDSSAESHLKDTETQAEDKKSGKKRVKAGLAVALAAVAVAALSIYAAIPKKVTDISGIGATQEVLIGDTLIVDYDIEPDRFEDEPIVFSSSDSQVLTVDESGALTGVSVGEAVLQLKARDYIKSVKVSVLPKVADITGVDPAVTLCVGSTYPLKSKLLPEKYSEEPIIYQSSDKSVAEVSEQGVISAKGVGQTIITLAAGGCTKTVKITVMEKKKETVRTEIASGSKKTAGSSGRKATGNTSGGSSNTSKKNTASGAKKSRSGSSSGSGGGKSDSSKGRFDSGDYEYFQ